MTDPAFFRQPVAELARALIGMEMLVDGVGGLIVETEAYDVADPASHSFGGPTRRNGSMFGPAGCAYVYRIYGVHLCLNVVGGPLPGAAVLLRALQPTRGLDLMRERRGTGDARTLCSGPGKLCAALGVSATLDGASLDRQPFTLAPTAERPPVTCGPRIGITKGAQTPWRFGLQGSAFLSRPFPSQA